MHLRRAESYSKSQPKRPSRLRSTMPSSSGRPESAETPTFRTETHAHISSLPRPKCCPPARPPKGEVTIQFQDFDLETKHVNVMPVDQEILVRQLENDSEYVFRLDVAGL